MLLQVVSKKALYSALLCLILTSCSALATIIPETAPQVTVRLPNESIGESPLSDAVVYGEVTITSALPTSDKAPREASFYLDDATATGEPILTATTAPTTIILDTRTLLDGPHSLTLRLVTQDDETSLEHLPFVVGNEAFEMLGVVNDLRARGYDCGTEGVFGSAPALRLEFHLMNAAQRQADDMHTNDFMDHTGSDGSTVGSRVNDAGYTWSRIGENLASGQQTTAEVVAAWAESDGHCANLLNPSFTELGVGHAGSYWAQVFARP